MNRYFGCDAHKRYSIFTSVDDTGNVGPYVRVENNTVGLYMRLREKRGHAKAVVAVARHLAGATYWVQKKGEPYKEKSTERPVSSTRE